jgi:predicted MFS family arabinose efflux permease
LAEAKGQARYSAPFFLAMLTNFFFFASIHLLMWTLPLYVSVSLKSATAVGLVIGLMALTAVLLRPWAGTWADRHGRKIVILLGALCFFTAPLFYAAGSSMLLTAAGRLVHGLGICFFTTGYGSLIPDMAPAGRRGEAIGLGSITMPLSLMIVPWLGSAIQQRFGFQTLFFAAAGTALVAASLAWFLPKGNNAGRTNAPVMGFREVLARPQLLSTLVAVLALALAYGALTTFLPLFAVERGLAQGSYFFVGYGIALVLTSTSVGRLSDRLGRARVIAPGMVGVALCLAAMTQVRGLVALLALAVVYGLFFGAAKISVDALCVDCVPMEGRGSAVSAEYAIYDLGIGLGSWGLGAVADAAGYDGMFFALAGAVLVGLAVFLILLRRAECAS